ncbi:histidine phosphatase family protein [Pontibacterium granulatum]|uniref:SixA phosphatase family protein n=1 Tax=Pontibacterium granulatum TaxID=2036029 RepID=UPI00249A1A3F|nr:histidine phosphatase family protein [Pontibacterium granulatum]MDI3324982.1 histidine phosphatase family protein [Pontibacterium granulatum]
MRHGEASWQASCDAERPLTDNGRVRLFATLRENAARMQDVQHILHSPYLRAVQTAQIAGEVLGVDSYSDDALWTPDNDPQQAIETLDAFTDQTILVVTHNPLVSRLVGGFCGAGIEPFDTGTITCVDADWPAMGLGSLIWKA